MSWPVIFLSPFRWCALAYEENRGAPVEVTAASGDLRAACVLVTKGCSRTQTIATANNQTVHRHTYIESEYTKHTRCSLQTTLNRRRTLRRNETRALKVREKKKRGAARSILLCAHLHKK